MPLEEFTHICTLQFTNKDGETLDLDFANEEHALALNEYLKRNPPINLESVSMVKNIYQVDTWENEGDSWDQRLEKEKNPPQ